MFASARTPSIFMLIVALAFIPRASAQVIEAENATVLNGVDAVADAGASGGFRVRNFDQIGDYIQFTGVPSGIRLEITFSLSRDNMKQCSLYVNGVDVYTPTFHSTGAFTAYLSKQYYVAVGGTVELRIDADDYEQNRADSCASIDRIQIFQTGATSDKAFEDARGRVAYGPYTDSYGDHFLGDYSHCGYAGGSRGLPDPADIPVMATVSTPGVGVDAGPTIQAAIDAVSALPLDDRGFRGAVLLQAGRYEIPGTLSISASGVVLRGEGDSTAGTVLVATGVDPTQRTLITIAGAGFFTEVGGSSQDIVDDYVPCGARSFNVANASGFTVGDTVIVLHQSPQTWIDEIGMTSIPTWDAGSRDIRYDRVITKIDGNRITVDAPLMDAFDQVIDGGGRVYRYTRLAAGRITNSGIEYLRGESEFASATDEDHAWSFVDFDDIENGWARFVTTQYFAFSCVGLLTGAKWMTVVDCANLDPVSVVTGSRRYPFVIERGQLSLFRRCFSRSGRHDYVLQSQVPGPNVFLDGGTINSLNDTGPHQRWSTGVLFDNIRVYGHDLNIQNRGTLGTGHGWAGANQLVWNSRADDMIIAQPPTAQNWSIGSTVAGTATGDGYYESTGTPVAPTRLYDAQLDDRLELSMPGSVVYDEGVSAFVPTINAAADNVITLQVPITVDDVAATGARTYRVALGDVSDTNHLALVLDANSSNAVFTIESKGVGGTTQVQTPRTIDLVGGAVTYTLHARFELGDSSTDVIYKLRRDDVEAIAWEGETTLASAPAGSLNQLTKTLGADAVGSIGDVVVALGEIRRFTPVADAAVDQAAPTANVGTAAGLELNTSATDQVNAYLKFNVAGVTGTIDVARLRLHSDSLKGGVKVYAVADTSWSEAGITWNSKPATGSILAHETSLLAGQDFTLDVGGHVDANGVYALALLNDTESVAPLELASRESATPANVPTLEIIGDVTPVSVSLSGLVLE